MAGRRRHATVCWARWSHVPDVPDVRVVVVRLLDDRLASELSRADRRATCGSCSLPNWLDSGRRADSRRCTRGADRRAVRRAAHRQRSTLYASSFPVFASTRRGRRADRGAAARRRRSTSVGRAVSCGGSRRPRSCSALLARGCAASCSAGASRGPLQALDRRPPCGSGRAISRPRFPAAGHRRDRRARAHHGGHARATSSSSTPSCGSAKPRRRRCSRASSRASTPSTPNATSAT